MLARTRGVEVDDYSTAESLAADPDWVTMVERQKIYGAGTEKASS